jgi:flagellar export protein FliJ
VKGLAALIRLHRWRLDEKRRELAELERLEDRLLESVRQLDQEVAAEQAFAQQTNMGGFSYGGFAAGIIERRKRIAASMVEIRQQMDAKTEEVAEVFRELKRYEIAQDQRQKREQVEADRRAQAALDEISLIQHQRGAGS